LLQDIQQWKERLSSPAFAQYKNLFEYIESNHHAISTFDEAIEILLAALDVLLKRVEEIRNEALQTVPINEERLLDVGKWAYAEGFSKSTGAFPLPLFHNDPAYVETELIRRTLVLNGVSKGEFTKPLMAQLAANEEEYFGKMIRDRVAAAVMAEVIHRLKPKIEDGRSPEVYWEKIKRYAEEAKMARRNAILIIENRTIPDWIYQWTFPYYSERPEGRPPDLELTHDPNETTDAYVGTLNGINIYNMPLPPGASLLMTKESFKTVSFRKYLDGNFVSVVPRPIDEKPNIIDLELTWYFDLDIDIYPALKLSYEGLGRRQKRRS
jgi:hypothetical protein